MEKICQACTAESLQKTKSALSNKKSADFSRLSGKFEKKINETIKKYRLFTKKSRVLVACSGGKDSSTLLFVLKKLGYNIEAVTVDASIGCYTETNLQNLKKFCAELGVKLYEVSFRKEIGSSLCYIRESLKKKGKDYTSCHICGVLRRYLLNKKAKALKAEFIATGHNLDDEAQSIIMNILRGNIEFAARIGPKSGVRKAGINFVQRVKPMYFCTENEVVLYSKHHNLPVKYGRCPCSAESYRRKIREIFEGLQDKEKKYSNIVKAYLKIMDKLKSEYATQNKQTLCKLCHEPSSREICNTCSLIREIKT